MTKTLNVYHVLQVETMWRVNTDGPDRGLSSHNSKQEAMDSAKSLAKGNRPAQVIVYSRHGTVEAECTYPDEPPAVLK